MARKVILALSICAFFLTAFSTNCGVTPTDSNGSALPQIAIKDKINGVSFVSPSRKIGPEAFDPIVQVSADWIALIPFAFTQGSKDKLKFDVSWQWWGETSTGIKECIQMSQNKGLKVMIKPQVWFGHGTYTGDYTLDSESSWKTFEATYANYILTYAKIAADYKVDALCIGTEWRNFVKARPDFWKALIAKVREVYTGKVTYAANWDAYAAFPHWEDLDWIGIDAYFPLSESKTPTVKELKTGWSREFNRIKKLASDKKRPVLFTEYGYRSMDFTGKEPWQTGSGNAVNEQAQANAYQAIFEQFWDESWFLGGFLWKWYPNQSRAGGGSNNQFTPQNKKAQALIKTQYSRNS